MCYSGADEGTRTPNLRFTRPLLCLLSYVGSLGNLPQDDEFVKRRFSKNQIINIKFA